MPGDQFFITAEYCPRFHGASRQTCGSLLGLRCDITAINGGGLSLH